MQSPGAPLPLAAAILLAPPALADEGLVHRWQPGSSRSYKVDLFSLGQDTSRASTDWTLTSREQWSGVVTCTVQRPHVERCAFEPGTLRWGYLLPGEEAGTFALLPTDFVIALTWTRRGHLQRYEVTGDREPFWSAIAAAKLPLYRRDDVSLVPAAQRRLGAQMEQALAQLLGAALELELPKSPELSTWTGRTVPLATSWLVASVSSARVQYEVVAREGSVAHIDWHGRVSEAPTQGATRDLFVETEVRGSAHFDVAQGRVMSLSFEALAGSTTTTLAGHPHTLALASAWAKGEPTDPVDPPAVRLP